VLDLSRVLAGPVCTQLLADLGADVVKVERPGAGDDTRQWGPPFVDAGGLSGYYLSCNRGKRSLALDLNHPGGRVVVDDLVRRADVLVENFLPDSLARFGLGPERLKLLNPMLVSCSISGYGRSGPLAAVPGYDLMMQASAGIMSITGEPGGTPMKVGVAISDVLTGLYAAASVLAGLVANSASSPAGGHAWAFDLALADCTLASLVNVAQGALLTGERPKRWGNAHPQIVPYEVFSTSDGHVVLAVGADRQWERFCQAVGHDEWASDPLFQTNPDRVAHREELVPLLAALFHQRSTAHWRALLASAEVPHSPVLAIDEVLATPQVAARDMVHEVVDSAGRRYKLLAGAVHWQDEPAREPLAPPAIGQQSDEILREWLDYDDRRIGDLREVGAVA